MPYTYANLESRIRNNVNLQSATVADVIDDAINTLSNFFTQEKISTTISTVASQSTITKPTNSIQIIGAIKVGDDYFKRRESCRDLQEIEDYELERYEEADDKIYLYPTPISVKACIIKYKAGFTPLAGVAAAVTDVPDRLVALVVILATWLYWEKIATQTGTQRENFPDMSQKEASENANRWKENFDKLYETIKDTN